MNLVQEMVGHGFFQKLILDKLKGSPSQTQIQILLK